MSRLESGRIALRLDWYDLNDLLNKVIDELTDELKSYNLDVHVDDAMPLVRIDFGLMEQVLYNLIFNACQYAPATSKITVEAIYEKDSLVIRVIDEGPGFPGMALEQVFDKFYRAGMRKTGGLGLGLSIVRGFVEAHRGSVKAENRPEGGAAITVVIPSELPEINEINMDSSDD
jgi:two-component system sensor histidine kinase KdpD